jgi:hypothetical protein
VTNDSELHNLSREELMAYVLDFRNDLRKARDAQLDQKCWLDFFRLFRFLPEGDDRTSKILDPAIMRENCDTFITCMKCYLDNPDKSIDEIYEIWEDVCPYEQQDDSDIKMSETEFREFINSLPTTESLPDTTWD